MGKTIFLYPQKIPQAQRLVGFDRFNNYFFLANKVPTG